MRTAGSVRDSTAVQAVRSFEESSFRWCNRHPLYVLSGLALPWLQAWYGSANRVGSVPCIKAQWFLMSASARCRNDLQVQFRLAWSRRFAASGDRLAQQGIQRDGP